MEDGEQELSASGTSSGGSWHGAPRLTDERVWPGLGWDNCPGSPPGLLPALLFPAGPCALSGMFWPPGQSRSLGTLGQILPDTQEARGRGGVGGGCSKNRDPCPPVLVRSPISWLERGVAEREPPTGHLRPSDGYGGLWGLRRPSWQTQMGSLWGPGSSVAPSSPPQPLRPLPASG